jgi:hypothetical protein
MRYFSFPSRHRISHWIHLLLHLVVETKQFFKSGLRNYLPSSLNPLHPLRQILHIRLSVYHDGVGAGMPEQPCQPSEITLICLQIT